MTTTPADKIAHHVALLLAAMICAGAGGGVLIYNLKSPTTPVLIFSGSFFTLAVALAVPADFKSILQTCAPLIPWKRKSVAIAAITDTEKPE